VIAFAGRQAKARMRARKEIEDLYRLVNVFIQFYELTYIRISRNPLNALNTKADW
jgi:hypothetical protein